MDTRLEIDERIMKEEGVLEENETLKINIKQIAKDNKKLEKQINELQKLQLQLLEEAEAKAAEAEQLMPKASDTVTTDEVIIETLPDSPHVDKIMEEADAKKKN